MAWTQEPLNHLPPLIDKVELVDEVVIVKTDHAVQGCEEITLVDLHKGSLTLVILALHVTLLNRERAQRPNVATHLARDELIVV